MGDDAPETDEHRPSRAHRSPGLYLGRIAGIALIISPSWLISAVLIVVLATPIVGRTVPHAGTIDSVVVSAVLAILLGVSVLAHELGHCLLARLYGIRVREIRLYLVGGVSELEENPDKPTAEALIAAAGPAVSAALAVICWFSLPLTDSRSIAWLILLEMAVANAVVAVFNILPALPLDGGRVLRAVIWRAFGRERLGTIVAGIGGFLVSAALVVWAVLAILTHSRAGLLEAAIVAVMAFFVAAGAVAEWPRKRGEPVAPPSTASPSTASPSAAGMTSLPSLRPVVILSADESLRAALDRSRDAAVVLTGPEGRTLGILDTGRAAALAGHSRRASAAAAVSPLMPDMVAFASDEPAWWHHQMRARSLPYVMVMGDDGRPDGVLMWSDGDRAAPEVHRDPDHYHDQRG